MQTYYYSQPNAVYTIPGYSTPGYSTPVTGNTYQPSSMVPATYWPTVNYNDWCGDWYNVDSRPPQPKPKEKREPAPRKKRPLDLEPAAN